MMVDVYKDIFTWSIYHGGMLIETQQDAISLLKLIEFGYCIFIRLINNFWDEPATLTMRYLFFTEMRLYVDKCSIKKRGLYCYLSVFFFVSCYLATLRPTLGHCQGGSPTHLMLITAIFTYSKRRSPGAS